MDYERAGEQLAEAAFGPFQVKVPENYFKGERHYDSNYCYTTSLWPGF